MILVHVGGAELHRLHVSVVHLVPEPGVVVEVDLVSQAVPVASPHPGVHLADQHRGPQRQLQQGAQPRHVLVHELKVIRLVRQAEVVQEQTHCGQESDQRQMEAAGLSGNIIVDTVSADSC